MKKLATIIIALFALSFASKAQFYAGGTAGFGINTGSGPFSWVLSPEAGYGLNDKMAVGASIDFTGYIHNNAYQGSTSHLYFSPYFRYKFLSLGNVDFVADGVVELGTTIYTSPGSTSGVFLWGIVARPAITYSFLPRWTLITKLGALGVENGAFKFSVLQSLGVGVYYSF